MKWTTCSVNFVHMYAYFCCEELFIEMNARYFINTLILFIQYGYRIILIITIAQLY